MDEGAERLEVQYLHGKRESICGGHKREGESSYPGRSDGVSAPEGRRGAPEGVADLSEVSRGHSRPVDTAEGPNTERGRRLNLDDERDAG